MPYWPLPGLNHVDEYAASGWPWVETGDLLDSGGAADSPNIVLLEFPAVTKFIVVHNAGDSELQFAFANEPQIDATPAGRAMGFYTTAPDQRFFVVQPRETSPSLEIKCKKLYLRSIDGDTKYSVAVGYTNIPKEKLPDFENNRAEYEGV
jgi:hypothetical protein